MSETNLIGQISQQELQHLITVSTGFIDTYVVKCAEQVPMLLPQNVVLAALDSPTQVKTVPWHDHELPVYHVSDYSVQEGVALVIEADDNEQRFALMCEEMPQTMRLRISEVVDEEVLQDDPQVFQLVRVGEQIYHVPNLAYIQTQLRFK